TEGQALADYQIIALAGVLSEGNTCHPSGVYYYNNDRTVINDFVENVRQFNITDPTVTVRRGNHYEVYAGTGRDAKFSAGQNPWNKGISWKRGLRYGGAMLESEAGPEKSGFRIWIEELGLAHKKSADKFIPRDIFALPPDKLALFLGRLWSGDGYIYGKSSIAPFYSTSSKKLSMQLQQLLLRFGILSRVAKKTFKYAYKNIHKEKRGYIVLLQGRAGVEVFLGQICPHVLGKDRAIRGLKEYYRTVPDKMESPDVIPAEIKIKVKAIKDKLGVGWRELEARSGICMKEFYGSVKPRKRGFRRSTIRKLGEYLESPELLRYASSDIYWDRIRSISYVGEEPTYDLEVKDTHNFIANGIIVHNSHSTAYAMISYRTAYLKANYPVEFMTALLTSEKDNMDKIVDYISQSNKMGIKILPPDIKESFAKFTVVRPKDSEPAIRFGLSAVKNVGQGAIDSIIEARKVFGFNSLQDFCQHIDSRLVNRKVIESLIKCGAFDSFGYRRSQLMSIVDKVLDVASDMQKDRARGQYSFFDDFSNGEAGFGANLLSDVPDIQEWPEHQLLAYEKEMLGFYLTKHPLTRYERLLRTFCGCSTKTTSKFRDGQEIAMGGIFTKVKNTVTKRTGEKMAIATLEDLDGTIEVLVFPSSYQKVGGFVKVDNFVYIKGRLSLREESPKLIAGDIMSLDEAQYKCARVVNILVKNNGQDKNTFDSLKRILSRNRGQVPVCLTFKKEGDSHVDMLIGRDYYVHPSERLSREVEELLGQNTICLRS
ncbi:MAG: LAGLIDADG family homing endonuclease, partial [Candidatus Omnitrophota bacterium]